MGRRINEGDISGLKQDRYRHSRFEYEDERELPRGVNRADGNTINGPYFENRGRRGDEPRRFNPDSPFENGRISNWGRRQGWDDFFRDKSFRRGRLGGAILNADEADHSGRGPKGYKRLDENIYEEVCEALSLSREVDASGIEVSVKDGCVYLKGAVDSRQTKRMAELAVENISGVQDVQNLLTISRGEDYAQKQ